MQQKHVIAVVEDDPEILDLVNGYLTREQFEVIPCANGEVLDQTLSGKSVDLIVLDLMMPGEDGLSICRRLSSENGPPIIILSAKAEDVDRIVGLEIGADDYLTKPFNPRELSARIRAVLRRRGTIEPAGDANHNVPPGNGTPGPTDDREIYIFENWLLDADGRALTDPSGAPVILSSGEFALLLAFARRPRRTLTRDQLLDWTRGTDSAPVDRAIDVQLSRLRRKLGDNPRQPRLIKTVRGDGYLFAADVRKGHQP